MPNIRIITSAIGRAQRSIGRARLNIGRASALPGLYKTTPVRATELPSAATKGGQLRCQLALATGHIVSSSVFQGCARLMSRESNLTRLRLK